MLYKHVEFFKAALVQKQGQTLAGRKLSLGMLGVNPFLTASQTCRLTTLDKGVDLFVLNLIVHNITAFVKTTDSGRPFSRIGSLSDREQ